jgi:hypothetical protein
MSTRWNIYYILLCRQARPNAKPKFVVIVCHDEAPFGFIINSRINQEWAEENPSYKKCQVSIKGKPMSGLLHDSFVDCYDLHRFSEIELTDCRGPIPTDTIVEIKKVVGSTRVIIERRKRLILEE